MDVAHKPDVGRDLALVEAEKRVLAGIAAGRPLADVLDLLLRTVEAHSPGPMLASILLRDAATGRLTHGAAPSLPAAYCQAIDGTMPGPAVGSCGTAAYLAAAVYVEDIAADPLWADYRELAAAHGLRACWSTPIRATDGRILGTFATYYRSVRRPEQRDIDTIALVTQTAAIAIERHETDQALRESEARFRQLADAMPGFVWTTNAHGRQDYVSPMLHAYTGQPPQQSDGDEWMEAIHPDDRARIRDLWDKMAPLGLPHEAEYRLRDRDGGYGWFLSRARPIKNERGEVTRWVGANFDIGNLRRVQEELRHVNATLEEEVARRTLEHDRLWLNSPDLLVVLAGNGVLQAVNPAWTTVLGYRADELLGRAIFDFLHPDDVAVTRDRIALYVHEPRRNAENRYRHKNGGYRWFAWNAASFEGLIYANGRHITAEKQQAEILRQTEAALRQAQKMEAVGQLTGGIAHDFNNLLTGILGSMELLRAAVTTGRREQAMQIIDLAEDSSQRATRLIQRLLTFSRHQALDVRSVDLNALVRSVEDLLRRTLGESIALEIALDEALWRADSDPSQLENALLNLTINSRDAMPDGGRLTISTGNAVVTAVTAHLHGGLAPGRYVVLRVADTGSGMPQSVIDRAFEPFFTTKPVGQGTGLGLSMVYGLAQQSNGIVRIDSALGRGTTIVVYLAQSNAAAAPMAAAAAPARPPIAAGGGRVVLVVEDDPAIQLLMTMALGKLGYNVLTATTGTEAVPILESTQPLDLLITDLGLPGLNGRAVAAAGRAARPGLKVLFVTGYADNAPLPAGGPATALIAKPFTMQRLSAAVTAIL